MTRKYEAQVPTKTIHICNESDNSMIIRRIGEDERVVLKSGNMQRFQVPYNGLIIGYSEKAGE